MEDEVVFKARNGFVYFMLSLSVLLGAGSLVIAILGYLQNGTMAALLGFGLFGFCFVLLSILCSWWAIGMKKNDWLIKVDKKGFYWRDTNSLFLTEKFLPWNEVKHVGLMKSNYAYFNSSALAGSFITSPSLIVSAYDESTPDYQQQNKNKCAINDLYVDIDFERLVSAIEKYKPDFVRPSLSEKEGGKKSLSKRVLYIIFMIALLVLLEVLSKRVF